MKNKVLMMGMLLLMSAASVWAVDYNFIVSATIPKSTSVGVVVSQVNAASNQWTPVTGTNLSFGTLALNTTLGIYLPTKFFVIDASPSGANSDFQITFDYIEGSNPNGTGGHGFGWKSSASFVKTTGSGTNTVDHPLPAHGKKLLKDIHGETLTSQELSSGWSRTYVGIVTKDPNAQPPDPAQAEPFTASDKAGDFDGTLRISATIL